MKHFKLILFIVLLAAFVIWRTIAIYTAEQPYIYRESVLYDMKWKRTSKDFMDKVKNKDIDLDLVFDIMETEGVSVEEMDSIIGDSLWRVK